MSGKKSRPTMVNSAPPKPQHQESNGDHRHTTLDQRLEQAGIAPAHAFEAGIEARLQAAEQAADRAGGAMRFVP